MCQVHTGAYVSLLAPGTTDYTTCYQGGYYHVHITRSTHHYAYTRQTQVSRKKMKQRKEKKRQEEEIKESEKGNEIKAVCARRYPYTRLSKWHGATGELQS